MADGPADERFLERILTSLGFISLEALAAFREGLAMGEELGEALCREGLLERAQLDFARGLEGDGTPPPPPRESQKSDLFGRLAVMKRLATEGQVEECLEIQEELKRQGCYVRLGELLVRKAYLNRKDVEQVLAQQEEAPKISAPEELSRSHERALSAALAEAEAAAADAPSPPEAPPAMARETAFDLLVELKRLAAAGQAEACRSVAEKLRQVPEYAAVAERLERKAYLSRAAAQARKGKAIVTCPACGAAAAVEPGTRGPCPRCHAPLR